MVLQAAHDSGHAFGNHEDVVFVRLKCIHGRNGRPGQIRGLKAGRFVQDDGVEAGGLQNRHVTIKPANTGRQFMGSGAKIVDSGIL